MFVIVSHSPADSATYHRRPSILSCCSSCMEQSVTCHPFGDFGVWTPSRDIWRHISFCLHYSRSADVQF